MEWTAWATVDPSAIATLQPSLTEIRFNSVGYYTLQVRFHSLNTGSGDQRARMYVLKNGSEVNNTSCPFLMGTSSEARFNTMTVMINVTSITDDYKIAVITTAASSMVLAQEQLGSFGINFGPYERFQQLLITKQ
jgi:hypothetical protein